jgi:signal transduction histidine kinase
MATALRKVKISFKQAFIVVMAVSMLCALVLSWIINSSLASMQPHAGNGSLYTIHEGEYSNEQTVRLTDKHKFDDVSTILNTWTPLVLFFISTVSASFVFYHWKMKKPLSILNASIHKINNKQLDFRIEYDVQDEMGELIHAFESMRKELYTSFTSQWRAQEDRKILNATFAHDIRTPLTVLKGHLDVLIRNVKMDRVDRQKIIETLSLLTLHINRMESYTNEMSTLQRLDEIRISKKQIEWNDFGLRVQKNLDKLAESEGKTIQFNVSVKADNIFVDESVVTRIIENIVSNAVRYATETVLMQITESSDRLVVEIWDDGQGFSADALEHALEPFYQDNPSLHLHSEGLGLFICKTLIEKHGGSISLSNKPSGGSCVTLVFFSAFIH